MIDEVIQEARRIRYEMPAFTAAFLLLVALCVGVRAAIFYEADGEQLKLIADKSDQQADPMRRMYERVGCPMKIPGLTVIISLREYSMELSVPMMSVRSLLNNAHSDRETRVAV